MAKCKGKSLKELREMAGEATAEIGRLRDLSNDDSREWSGEDEAEWSRVNADYDQISRAITAGEAEARTWEPAETEPRRGPDHTTGERGAATEADRLMAFQGWCRSANHLEPTAEHYEAAKRVGVNIRAPHYDLRLSGNVNRTPCWNTQGRMAHDAKRVEYRDMSVGTDADGGYTVPEGFMAELDRQLLAFGGPRAVCRVVRTASGNDMPWPTVNDTSNTGALLAEGASIGSSVDPTFAAVTFNAYKYSSKPILISSELLEDSAFNMGQEIPSLLGERLGRITGAQFTTGTGSSQPNGIVTAGTVGVTAAATTAITSDELINLVHALDPAYRQGSTGFMMNDAVIQYIRKLVINSEAGNYVWQPGLQAGVPDMLLGYPVTTNQHMSSTITASDKTVLFGDFSKFVIRDVANMRAYRLEERYRDTDQTGFVVFSRHDSDALQSTAIQVLQQAAS